MRRTKLLVLAAALLWGQVLLAQVVVTGKVTDEKTGTPVSGATVSVKNTNLTAVTRADGSFSINAPENATLVVTYVGYRSFEVAGSSQPVTISLAQAEGSLSEVVVTGYTTTTRKQATGSISRVKAEDVRLQPVGSFEQQLQGKSAGVLIQSASGQPGSAANVTIRGKGSVLGSTQPLYIVDGIQISAQDFQSINPSDFETFNILKDAVATAQYGSRGANGVIVVTTRRGANAKTKVSYDYQHGIGQMPENRLELMNAAEKIAFERTANGIYGTNPNGWSDADLDSLAKIQGSWADALFRKARTNQHQLSLSGGNERTRFFVSGSVFKQEGVVIATGLDRYTGRVNLDHTMGNLKVGLNAFVGSSLFTNTSEGNAGIGSPLNAIRWHLPYVTPYLPDGSYNMADMNIQGQPNAVQELLENPARNKQLKGIAAVNLEYSLPFLKGLVARTNWGVDFTENVNDRYISRTTYLGTQQRGTRGSFAQSFNRGVRYTGTSSLGYRKTVADHSFSVNLFNEIVKRKFNSFGYTGYGLVGPLKNGAGITPGTADNGYIPAVSSNETEQALLSYFAIADYSFKNRYFLNATVRRDGDSRLADGKKWTSFGGVGASWNITSEDFLANSRNINDLRLKVSYGSAGNSNVGGAYEALEQFSALSYNGVGGLVLTNFKKPGLTWERRTTFNAGVDFGFFKNRVSGTVEVYNALTTDMYLSRQISGTNGAETPASATAGSASTILTNMGELRNRGVEATINAVVVRNADFSWNIQLNHTYNRSRVLQLDGTEENVNGLFLNKVGERQNSIYVVRYAGVNPQTGVSQYLTRDGQVTETYDPADRVIVGTIDPPHFGGVTNTINYKGLELNVLLSYMYGNKIYNNDRTNVENPAYYYSSLSKDMARAWSKPGDITNVPTLLDDFQTGTSRFVEDGGFLRLRNVMLSYNLPKNIASRIRSTGVRFFVQGQNLYTWHKVNSYDPEGNGNLVGAVYPPLKTYTFGVTVGF